ncbi:MAG TPA: hypothetical protein VK126_02040 [Nitrososphaerales archaeon]|nr:hypothetical protein [Nitrososphaerales archaeon]
MIGGKLRMPKRARYPLFLLGLLIILLGGLAANSIRAPQAEITAIVFIGFLFLIVSVLPK